MQLIFSGQNSEFSKPIVLNNQDVTDDLLGLFLNYIDFSSVLTLKVTSKHMNFKVKKLHEEYKFIAVFKGLFTQVINHDISWGHQPNNIWQSINLPLKRIQGGDGAFFYEGFGMGLTGEYGEFTFSENMALLVQKSDYDSKIDQVVKKNNAFCARAHFDFENNIHYLSRVEFLPYNERFEISPEMKRLENLINATVLQYKLNIAAKPWVAADDFYRVS